MTIAGTVGILAITFLILLFGIPSGGYLYRVFTGKKAFLEGIFAPSERLLYRLVGVNSTVEMDWKAYIKSLLLVNLVMMVFAFLILQLQGVLPLNPDHIKGMPWDLAFNTAVSFVTNTNWQNYAGEQSVTYLSQMMVIQFLQFTSAATGAVAAIAFVRSLAGKAQSLGNFWVDIIRYHVRVLIPFAFVLGLIFVGLGIPQTLHGSAVVNNLQGATQTISRGPVASLEAIKQLGTNGGGYFNANSAHPFEDPSALACVIEIMAMALIPTALITTFARFIRNRKQAIVLYVFLTGLLLLGAFLVYASETAGNTLLQHMLGISGPNMEGKEVRFGSALSAVFTAATTSFTTGAVNTMHDSLTSLGGLVPLKFVMFNIGHIRKN